MGSRGQWGFPSFFRPQWQSLCTTLTSGKCLPLRLCQLTISVRTESRHDANSVIITTTGGSTNDEKADIMTPLGVQCLLFIQTIILFFSFNEWRRCQRCQLRVSVHLPRPAVLGVYCAPSCVRQPLVCYDGKL